MSEPRRERWPGKSSQWQVWPKQRNSKYVLKWMLSAKLCCAVFLSRFLTLWWTGSSGPHLNLVSWNSRPHIGDLWLASNRTELSWWDLSDYVCMTMNLTLEHVSCWVSLLPFLSLKKQAATLETVFGGACVKLWEPLDPEGGLQQKAGKRLESSVLWLQGTEVCQQPKCEWKQTLPQVSHKWNHSPR